MKFRLLLVPFAHPAPASYGERKVTGKCVRRGCVEPCRDDHLLCDRHAVDHRERNKRWAKMARRRRRVQMRLWR